MIKDVEHKQNCNNILKSKGMPENYEIFNQLQKTQADYEEKFAKLKKFTAKSKASTKVMARVHEWIEEQNRLQNLAFKIEQSVRSCFESAIVTSPEFTALHDLMQSISEASKERKLNESEVASQLHEVKQMLLETKKAQAKAGNGVPSSSSAATSIIADLLVKIRTSHSENWALLKRQEEEYYRDLSQCQSRIAHMIRNDVLTEQDNQLRLELDTIVRSCSENSDVPQVDEFELDLVINEWYNKLSTLDIEHEANMKCKEIEKLNYCQELSLGSEEGVDMNELFKLGGWKAEDHEVFTKIFKKAQVTGMLRKVMTDLMVSQLPHIPHDEILLHEEWYRKMRSISNKYKESEQVYVTTRADLVQEAKQAVLAFRDAQREKWVSEQQLQESEKHRQELHSRLHEMRLKKEELTAAQREEELRKQEEEQRQQQAALELQQREQQHRRELVLQFQAAQAEAQRVDRERREKEQREREEEIRRLIDLNRPKVEMRAQLLAEKEQKQQQREVSEWCAFFDL